LSRQLSDEARGRPARDEGKPVGSSGTSNEQAFRQQNAYAGGEHHHHYKHGEEEEGEDTPTEPELGKGPQAPELTAVNPQEGTGAIGAASQSPAAIVHHNYYGAAPSGAPEGGIDGLGKARDNLVENRVDLLEQGHDRAAKDERDSQGFNDPDHQSPANLSSKLSNPPGVGLHSSATDDYGEIAGGFAQACNPQALALIETCLINLCGCNPVDAKRIALQHCLAPMERANFAGTGAPARDTPVPFVGMPTTGASDTPNLTDVNQGRGVADNCRKLAGDHIGFAMTYGPRDVAANKRLRAFQWSREFGETVGPINRTTANLACAKAEQMALDRAKSHIGPSAIFAASGAGRISVL
jgi:hypothetical protein